MDTEIAYFSGTGNSLAAGRDLAAKLGGRLVAIAPLMDNASISSRAGVLGIVFPVYHGNIPLIISRFIARLADLENKYIFAVCTYGDSPGLTLQYLRNLIQARGGQLAAGFAVHMPYNYITPSLAIRGFFSSFTLREISAEKQQALFAGAQEKTEAIAAFVRARKSGPFEINADWMTRLADHFDLKESLGKYAWLKIAGVGEPTALPFLESRQLMDRAFHADEKCNGCGICAKICPVHNIELVGGQPLWQQRCEQCFACLQWCPKEAIQFGSKTAGGKRYHHPAVKLAEML